MCFALYNLVELFAVHGFYFYKAVGNVFEKLFVLFENISDTKDNFDQIRSNVNGIREACDTLNDTIKSLSAISEQNAQSAEVTSDACAGIIKVIGNVTDKADSIKHQSDDLGNMVGSYKV